MRKSIVIALCVALGLILVGGALVMGSLKNGVTWKDIEEVSDTMNWNEINFSSVGSTSDYESLNATYSADGKYSFSAADIKSLDLKWVAGSVTVLIGEEDTVLLQETGSYAINENTALRYGVSDGVLTVQYCKKGYIGKLPEKKLLLTIPRSLALGMEDFSFSGASSSLTANDLIGKSCDIAIASGEIALSDCTFADVECASSSGSVSYKGSFLDCSMSSASGDLSVISVSSAEELELSASSGDVFFSGACAKIELNATSGAVRCTGVNAKEAAFSTASGRITVAGKADSLKASSSSGRIDLDLENCPQALDAEATSGDIRLRLPADSGFTADYSTTSGDFSCDFSAVTGKSRCTVGGGESEFSLQTTSGDIAVLKK